MRQRFPQARPSSLCPRQSSSRNHCLASPTQTSRYQGNIHQRPRKGHLRTQPGERTDHEEGRALARCQRRKVEKGHKARQEYERECKRYLGSFPRLKVVCLISRYFLLFYDYLVQHFQWRLGGIPRVAKNGLFNCTLSSPALYSGSLQWLQNCILMLKTPPTRLEQYIILIFTRKEKSVIHEGVTLLRSRTIMRLDSNRASNCHSRRVFGT